MKNPMDHQQGMPSKITPLFKGYDYDVWRIRMKSHLMALGFYIWKYVEDGYTTPYSPPTNVVAKKLCNDNSRAINSILSGLSINVFVKVMHCKSTKELWEKLKLFMKDMER
jgi:hypothetical protein